VNLNASYEQGLTPVMWAAGPGHVGAGILFLTLGASASALDDRGMTALDLANAVAPGVAQSGVVANLSALL
jgi:uncharacterized protein